MARKKRIYEDDDGRTIADMSDVRRPNLFLPQFPPRRGVPTPPPAPREPEVPAQAQERPWEEQGLTKKQQFWYMLGALKAALLIAAVFIIGLGLVIALLLFLW